MSKLLAGDKENIRDRNQPTRLLSAGDNSLKTLGLTAIRRELNPSVQDKSARGIAKPTTVGKAPPQVSIQGLVQGGIIPYNRKVVKTATKIEEAKDNLAKLRIGQVTATNLGLTAAGLQKPSSNTNLPAQSTSTTRYQSKPKPRKPEESQNVLLEHKQSLLGSFNKAFGQPSIVSGVSKGQGLRRAKENHDQSSISNTSEVSEVSRQRKGGESKLNTGSGEQLHTLAYKSTEATLASLHHAHQVESLLANNAPTTKQKKLTTYNPAVLKKIGTFQNGQLATQKTNMELLNQYHSGLTANGLGGVGYLKESGVDNKISSMIEKSKGSSTSVGGIATTIKSKNSLSIGGNTEMSYGTNSSLGAGQTKVVLLPGRVGNESLLCNENILPKYEILGHVQLNARGISNDHRGMGDKLFGGMPFESATQRLAATKNFNPLHIKQKQVTAEEEIAAFEQKLRADSGSPLPQTIQNLMKVEAEYSPDPYYLDKFHTEITWLERAILLDWLAEVSVFFVLKNSTYYLTVNYIDRYMTEVKNVEKSQFQLVGITALLIATKVEEIYVRPIAFLKDIAHNQFSTEAIMAMEVNMMKVLKWKVHPPTLHILFNWYTTQWDLFLDTDPDCKMHPMIKHEPTLRLTFHELNHNSYNRYRELMQLLDCALLDVQTLQYKLHPLVAAFMYILLGKDFKQFTLEQITETFSQSSKYLLNKEFAFNNLFAIFMEKNFSFELEDLLPCIQYASTFFSLPLSMKLNPSLDVKALQNGPYEEFIAFQMHNDNALGFVTNVRKRDIYSQDYQ